VALLGVALFGTKKRSYSLRQPYPNRENVIDSVVEYSAGALDEYSELLL
jgi:hypothetical protein